ncbi:MAG: hypothetical protein LBQ08_04845, partial [Holosporaceae bacterium]|nr:hypothetical protein [Holosporaceae bacterium]
MIVMILLIIHHNLASGRDSRLMSFFVEGTSKSRTRTHRSVLAIHEGAVFDFGALDFEPIANYIRFHCKLTKGFLKHSG